MHNAWMVSGKRSFDNGFDVRFSHVNADEWECDDIVGANSLVLPGKRLRQAPRERVPVAGLPGEESPSAERRGIGIS